MPSSYAEQFTLLPLQGLYVVEIEGDGNCLFSSLSDQMYGSADQSLKIRATVIDQLRRESHRYKRFLEVFPGGGHRRNPKRKNAGTYSSSPIQDASEADYDRAFDHYVAEMAQGGTWGGNMEIQAFAAACDVNIVVHQPRELSYVISAPSGNNDRWLHIAYSTEWAHFASIRNIDGPHQGIPYVKPKPLSPSLEDEYSSKRTAVKPVAEWQLNALSQAYPFADRAALTNALEQTNGSIDDAYERLIAADEQRSVSSQQSSNFERDADSGNESGLGPNKRQDRRMSRASKSSILANQVSNRYNRITDNSEKYKDSLESLVNATATSYSLTKNNDPRHISPGSEDGNDDEEDDDTYEGEEEEEEEEEEAATNSKDAGNRDQEEKLGPPPLIDGDTSSGSEYTFDISKPRNQSKIAVSLIQVHNTKGTDFATKPQGAQTPRTSSRKKKELRKQAKKQAARQAAKEQRALGNSAKKPPTTPAIVSPTGSFNHPTAATNAMRTLYI